MSAGLMRSPRRATDAALAMPWRATDVALMSATSHRSYVLGLPARARRALCCLIPCCACVQNGL